MCGHFFWTFQAIGCLGAVRMNERLLNLYYNVLVVLLCGDVIVGVVWLFRYNYIVTNLRSDLKTRLNQEYGLDAAFQVNSTKQNNTHTATNCSNNGLNCIGCWTVLRTL